MRMAGFESVALLTMFVIANLSEAARDEFLSTLRDQIARAQGRARFAAIRELEERRVNEQIAEQLGEMEKVITAALHGDIEDVFAMSGLRDWVRMSVELGLREGEPPEGSLLL